PRSDRRAGRGRHGHQWSSVRRPPCGDDDSAHPARPPDMAGSSESHCRAWGGALRGTPPHGSAGALPPHPLLDVEVGRGGLDELIVAPGVSGLRSLCPARTWAGSRSDDDTTLLGVEFDLIAESGLLQERLGDSNSAGVADGNDAAFNATDLRHGKYNVVTSPGRSK